MRRWVLTVAAAGLALVLLAPCGGARHPRIAVNRSAAMQSSAPPAPVPLTQGWRYRADPQSVGRAQGWEQPGAASAGWAPVSIPND